MLRPQDGAYKSSKGESAMSMTNQDYGKLVNQRSKPSPMA